jgi:hypothetical protein
VDLVTLEEVLAGKHLVRHSLKFMMDGAADIYHSKPPLSLKDFEEYLLFEDRSSENL